jgi:hypothetical protein
VFPVWPYAVDVVTYWINSSDNDWRQCRENAKGQFPVDIQPRWEEGRLANDDALLFSLRSIALHAPFIRRIHIVTNGHTPFWLNASHPRVHVVDQASLVKEESFNIHALAYRSLEIPGIARYFLHMTDDLFITAPLKRGDVFDEAGRTLTPWVWYHRQTDYFSKVHCNSGAISDWAKTNSVTAIRRSFRVHEVPYIDHAIVPYDCKVLLDLLQTLNVSFMSSHQFRSCHDWELDTLYLGFSYFRHRAVRTNGTFLRSFSETMLVNGLRDGHRRRFSSIPFMTTAIGRALLAVFPDKAEFEL